MENVVMTFKVAQQGAVTVIELDGNLMGGPDASQLNSKLHELADAGKKLVVINMARLKFMNSSGLGLLIGGVNAMRNVGGDLKIANASEKIAALIKIAKLSPLFENYRSVKEAVASFSK